MSAANQNTEQEQASLWVTFTEPPTSTNAMFGKKMWKSFCGTKKFYPRSVKYDAWRSQAFFDTLRDLKDQKHKLINGNFVIAIWPPNNALRDIDNYVKACLDFAQSHKLITNDRLCVGQASVFDDSKKVKTGFAIVECQAWHSKLDALKKAIDLAMLASHK